MDDLEILKKIGTNFVKNNLFTEVVEDFKYDPKHPLMGRSVITGKYIRINCSESRRFLIIGITRSGKTFTLRRFLDIFSKSGDGVFVATDVKNEFKSSIKPLQKKFHSLLLPGEQARATKVVTLRPTFFKQRCPEDWSEDEKEKNGKDKDNYWYSLDISNISKGDFMDLVKASSMGEVQQATMEEVYDNVKIRMNKGEKFSFDLIFEEIEANEDMKSSQKTALKRRLRPLLKSYFYESKWQRSLVDLIKSGFVPAINLEDFDRFGESGFAYPETLLSMATREVIHARRKGLLKMKIWIFIDEGARFAGIDKNNTFRKLLEESYELDSRYNINYLFATQTIETVPEKILKNSQWIMVPSRADHNTVKRAMIVMNQVRNAQSANNQASQTLKHMRKFKHSWLIMNNEGYKDIVIFGPPLSCHAETTD